MTDPSIEAKSAEIEAGMCTPSSPVSNETWMATVTKYNEACEEVRRLREEARFLLDRLEELDFGDDAERDFNGHVTPSMSRLRGLIDGPAVSPQDGRAGGGVQREPTPHWERRWPHDQPNGWNLDSAGFLALVQANPMMWLALGRAKYLELRIDTRDGGFNLYDRDGKPLNPDDVIDAINKVRADFGDAALTRAERSGGEV